MLLLEVEIYVLVCEILDTLQDLLVCVLIMDILRAGHDEARVNQAIRLLQLVNALDRVHLFHGRRLEVENDAVGADGDLQQTVVKLQVALPPILYRREVKFGHLGHLDVLQVVLRNDLTDGEAPALVLVVKRVLNQQRVSGRS